ncbi:MAG: aminotransferase class I/II-fold pyridoxal phosphate-dependent enzyme [Opitutaceae bacterium]|nr:aminotransferase class I/II-fold pyridoxal phosphate-dependent enzyme [Cytophagales bacterium]
MIIPLANRLKQVEDYYFVKKLEEIKKLNDAGKDIISFGIGSPDMAPSQNTVQALVDSARNSKNHGYQPYRGLPELRQGIADFYEDTYKVKLNPANQILPLLGSKEGILHISMAFLNPGDKVLVPDPGYPTYTSVSNLLSAEIVTYDLTEETGWYPDLAKIEKQDLTGVRMMWINYPHMPTGAKANLERFAELIAFAKKHQILLCHDNPYSLVLNDDEPISILSVPGAFEVAIELNSLSKSFNMAGWRVGMVVGREDYLGAILRVKSNIDSGMFLPVQLASIEALKNEEEWHDARNQEYFERRQLIFQFFDKLGFTYDKQQMGLFVWAKAPDTIKDVPAYADFLLYDKNIFVTPGIIFGKNGGRYLRASLCVSQARAKMALERL